MIAEHPIGPATGWEQQLIFVDQLRDRARVPRRTEQNEIERQVYATEIAAVIRDQAFERQIDFSNQDASVEFIDNASQSGDHIVHLGRSVVCRGNNWPVAGWPVIQFGLIGLSRNWSSLSKCQITSTRNPSTPRASQNALRRAWRPIHPGCAS